MISLTEKYVNLPNRLRESIFEKVFEIAQFTPEQHDSYEDSLKNYRDMKNVIDTAHIEGEEKGIIKGRVEGRAEGRIEGETKAKKEMAKILLQKGLDLETIMVASGLSQEEIEKLSE
ncbi:MAG: hypothetical protein ACK5LR_08035 [Mangrovibacterium sp.]